MTRDEFKILVKGMKAVYAQQTFLPDKDAFDMWFALLQDLPYKLANVAIQKHMLTEKFPPTPAEIREKAAQMIEVPETEMSELEAWALVRKAIRNSGYHAQEEFDKLPEACREAVGNAANLEEWAKMDYEKVESVGQSHFIRNFRTAVLRIKEEQRLPEQMRKLISEMRESRMKIEDKEQG
jgi:hypothetical protein